MAKGDKVEVQNVNHPGLIERVDAEKYTATRRAMLAVLTDQAPGMTAKELQAVMVPHLPQDLFPSGAKSGWWMKTVQLDLEAKGVIVRASTKPLRWHRV